MAHSDTHRLLHAMFNDRAFDQIEPHLAPGYLYEDLPQGLTIKTGGEFVDYLKAWVAGFSDGRVDNATYLDGPDFSVATYHGRGVNDGQFGPIPATGRSVDLPFCEVLHFASDGSVLSGENYYDQLSMMRQLGLAPDPHEVVADEGLEPVVRRIFAAYDALDVEAAKQMMATDAQGVDEISRRWMRGQDDISEYFRNVTPMLADVRSEISNFSETIWGDTGVATFWIEQDYTLEGTPTHVSAPTTMVLRREGGEWKAALVHSIPLPEAADA